MSYIKLTNIVLTAVFVVNGFMFALPVMAQAQAVEKQAIEQMQLSEAQKAELEKAQKEAKLAMYKELNLSATEQKFVEKYTDKMGGFNQALDKYVSYNKKNGNATLNAVAVYNNLKSISKETGLTQSQVLTLKDIALKMVKNYNKTVNSIANKKVAAQKIVVNGKSSSQEIPEQTINKIILDRGVKVESYASDVATKSITVGGRNAIEFYWSGYKIYLNGTTIGVLLNQGVAVTIGLVIGCAYSAYVTCAAALGYALVYSYWVYNYNIDCGRRGVFLEAQYWHWNFPLVKRVC